MQRPPGQEYVLRAIALTTVVVGAFAVWIGVGLGGATSVSYADDVGTAAAALAAAALCARAAVRHRGRLRVFWWLLAAACSAWTAAEVIWGFYELVLGRDVPAASWADVGYLAAMPLAAAALLVHPALHGRTIGRVRSALDGLVIAAALFFLSWMLVLEPLRRASDLSTLGGVVTLAYPVGDIVILFLVVLVIRGTTSGDRLDLWCLLGGLLALTLSDSLYGYLTQVHDYTSGQLLDAGWFAGYLGIALGAYGARARATSPRALAAPSLSSAAVITPFLPLLGALTLTAIEVELGRHLDRVALTTALVLVVLVLARQVLLLVDLLAPADDPVGERLVGALGRAIPDAAESRTGSR